MYDLYVSGRSCNVCISMLWLRVTSIIACDCWWFAHRFDAQNGRANHGACKIGPARHALELHHEPFRELFQRQVTKPYKTIHRFEHWTVATHFDAVWSNFPPIHRDCNCQAADAKHLTLGEQISETWIFFASLWHDICPVFARKFLKSEPLSRPWDPWDDYLRMVPHSTGAQGHMEHTR